MENGDLEISSDLPEIAKPANDAAVLALRGEPPWRDSSPHPISERCFWRCPDPNSLTFKANLCILFPSRKPFLPVVGRAVEPQHIHIHISRPCDCVTLHGKRLFEDVSGGSWDQIILSYLVGTHVTAGRQKKGCQDEVMRKTGAAIADFEDGRAPWTKEYGKVLEAERGKAMDGPRHLQKEHSPPTSWFYPSETYFGPLT